MSKKLPKFVMPKKPFKLLLLPGGVPMVGKIKCFFCDAGMKTIQANQEGENNGRTQNN